MREEPLVLIIASEWRTRALLGAQLREEGFDALGAQDEEEALARLSFRKLKPHIIFIDTLNLDLKAALERLSSLCKDVPLLICRGGLERDLDCPWNGRVVILQKPVTIGEIVNEIKNLIE